MPKFTPLPMQITIDTNVINAKGTLEAMNKIREWDQTQRVLVSHTLEPLETEITPGSPQEAESMNYLNQRLHADDPKFRLRAERLQKIMFPTTASLNDRQRRDIEHLIGAIHHDNDFFLTHDKDFLRCRQEISEEFSTQIVTPEEFVDRHAERIDKETAHICISEGD